MVTQLSAATSWICTVLLLTGLALLTTHSYFAYKIYLESTEEGKANDPQVGKGRGGTGRDSKRDASASQEEREKDRV